MPENNRNPDMVHFTLRLDRDTHTWLTELAEVQHRTIQLQIRHILAEYRRQHPETEPTGEQEPPQS